MRGRSFAVRGPFPVILATLSAPSIASAPPLTLEDTSAESKIGEEARRAAQESAKYKNSGF